MEDLRPQIIASRIKARKDELGITQGELATMIGKTPRELRRWEHADHAPTWPNILLLAEKLDCSPLWLAGLSDNLLPFERAIEEIAS